MSGLLGNQVHLLPLPLAQLARRALNGKSTLERHHCAYYLAEASLKLAASARVGLLLGKGVEPGSALAHELELLTLPSIGQWCRLLRVTNQAVGELPDAALLPLGRCARELDKKQDWQAVRALAEAAEKAGLVDHEVAKRGMGAGVVGFFDLISAYRNAVLGHGSQRPPSFYREFAGHLVGALSEVLAHPALLDGLELARPVLDVESGAPARWQTLTGLAGMMTEKPAGTAAAGQLYLVQPGIQIPLHPLLVARDDELTGEQVGFLNKTVLRTRRQGASDVEELRRVDYLDYASGATIPGTDAKEAVRDLLSRLRGHSVDMSAVDAAADQSSDSSEADLDATEPTLAGSLVGDFELLGELGRGGMGVVYKACQLSTRRIVALKVLPPMLASDAVALKRFKREISALARCDHPNVVKVLTAGQDGERHFYAMEFVDGTDLARLYRLLSAWSSAGLDLREAHLPEAIKTSAGLPGEGEEKPEVAPPAAVATGRAAWLRLAELFADAAEGLQHLHDAGVLHRDIKPSNLMVTSDGERVVLMDLGLARLSDQSQSLTAADVNFVGTLRYMAPEQLQRKLLEVDHRADVYGLGATLYELVTGHRVFDGDSEKRLIQQVLHELPIAPRRLMRGIPKDLETVIQVATSKLPEERYASAQAMAEDLRAVAANLPIKARQPGLMHRAGLWTRRNRGAVAAAGLVVLALLLLGLWTWEQRRIKVRYFENLALKHGVWHGVAEISGPLGRYRSYRVTTKGERVLEVQLVNAKGGPEAEENPSGKPEFDFSSYQYQYDTSGRANEVIVRGQTGRILQKHRLSWQGTRFQAAVLSAEDLRTSLDGSDAAMYRLTLDENGYQKQVTFHNDRGGPRRNKLGAYGFDFAVNVFGQITRRQVLDAGGQPSQTRDNIAAWEYRYDSRGRLVEERSIDSNRGLVLVEDGFAVKRRTYEERGNLSDERFYDAESQLAANSEGFATCRYRYDEAGARIEKALFGVDDKPASDRSGISIWRMAYDSKGYASEVRFFNEDGEPSMGSCAFCIQRWKKNDLGQELETRYFDCQDKLCLSCEGVAQTTYVYDSLGLLTGSSHFGVNGEPKEQGGVASDQITRDSAGRMISRVLLNQQGKRTTKISFSEILRVFDEQGRLVEMGFVDAENKPVKTPFWPAFRTYKYDVNGNRVEQSSLGPDRKLGEFGRGYATQQRRYDDQGNLVELKRLRADGSPAILLGIASVHRSYDDRGNEIEREYRDVAGAVSRYPRCGSIERRVYDNRDRLLAQSFFDREGHPCLNTAGYHGVQRSYDLHGNIVEERFLGTDGAPILNLFGYASKLNIYDSKRRFAWAPDPRDGDNGFGVGTTLFIQEELYFGTDEQLINNARGFASLRHKYSSQGNPTEDTFFDVSGRPTVDRQLGCAVMRTEYDAEHKFSGRRYLDTQGQPCADSRGYTGYNRSEIELYYVYDFLGSDGSIVAHLDTTEKGKNRELKAISDFKTDLSAELFHGSGGVDVFCIEPRGAAEQAGLQEEDVIVLVDGHPFFDEAEFRLLCIRQREHGARFTLIRDGQNIEIQVGSGVLGACIRSLWAPSVWFDDSSY